ncbi:hypothetical protein OG301_34705 [Streptomyces platensis]|uniref:allene oxide cyclase barrel-like domain-containing protein n=1 Tax=Streptomyces platensis TaxID=58346 RepID=UPI0022541C1B|nr:hypothetical protein [Streptomyces platensis]MCX4638591.1 hypothetical protein [Streptomyces platensis]WSI53997.1 hypothetical protein OG229_04370 [Streptomyces platensis]WTI56079.1 hypothetical protein OG301_34705 [Streptomyces platensis]WUB78400.1 hypothetical protein OG424_03875 [Streptomyces platensis]
MRRRRAAGLLSVALLLTGTVSCGSATTSTGDPGCVVLRDLQERAVGKVTTSLTGTLPQDRSPRLGDGSAYVRHLYGAEAEPTATVYGTSHVRRRMPNGHLLGYVDERIEFADGTMSAQGFYDLTAAMAGASQYVPTIGLTGSFRDKMGRRTFHTVAQGGKFSAGIEMCPAGMLK